MRIRPAYPLLIGLLAGVVACGGSGEGDNTAASATPAADQANVVPPIDPRQVPADLRPLIPLAQQWGIGDDVARLAKVDGATPEQRAELRRAVAPFQARITQWLDSFAEGAMSQEAATFMYLQLAIEEMTGLP